MEPLALLPRLRSLLALGLLGLLGSQPAAAQLTAQDATDLQAVEAAAFASLTSGDAATFAGLFREDVIFQPPNAPTIRSRAALEAWARGFAVQSLSWPNAQWHGDGDLAYVTTDYVLQIDELRADRGKQIGVYQRGEDGAWQISAVSFNSDLPAPGQADARNEAAVATLVSVENDKGYDRLDAVLAPDFRRYAPDANTEGLAAWKAILRQFHTAYPDFHIEMGESVFEGDLHFSRWTATGTAPATGRSLDVDGVSMHRFEDGMMTEEWAYFDPTSLRADAIASHEDAIRTFYSVYNTKEYDRLDAVLAPNFRRQGSDNTSTDGVAEFKAYVQQLHASYPDLRIEVRETVLSGDTGTTHWDLTGTDSETGGHVEISGMSLLRFQNGRIVEQMAYFDPTPLQTDAIAVQESVLATFFDVWNTREYDPLDDILAPGFRNGSLEGLDAFKTYMREQVHAYQDVHLDVTETLIEGDIGATQWTLSLTEPATGRRITLKGMSLLRFQDGRIAEHRPVYDSAPLRGE
jgi:predicted ester cyclase/ketosteroid isomerase-like protein